MLETNTRRAVDALLVRNVEPQAQVGGNVGERFRTARGGDHAVAAGGQFGGDGAADARDSPVMRMDDMAGLIIPWSAAWW